MKKVFVWQHGREKVKAPFNYRGCGLDGIWLTSGYDLDTVDGEEAVCVRNLDGLHKAIALSLVNRKKMLTGKEVRFLRHQLNLTQSYLARLLGCDAQQVARYEKEASKMPGPVDRLLRMLVQEHFENGLSVLELLRDLDELDAQMNEKQVFTATPDGKWAVG